MSVKPYTPRNKRRITGKTILCIPDSHAHPDHHNRRYEWLGRMAKSLQPDIIWDAGDWWDFPSLSTYDIGKKCFEGSRYRRDLEAGWEARDRFHGAMGKHTPERMVFTIGNHENRIGKVVENDPKLEGTIGFENLCSHEFGWEEIPFLQPVLVEGIALSHYFTTGIMGRAIGGEHPATMLLQKQFMSCLQAHSHQLDYADRTKANGQPVMAMHIGCYFDYDFHWAGKQPNRMYRRGVVVLRNVKNGKFDHEWVGIERVEALYG
jgi:hypothetical protein